MTYRLNIVTLAVLLAGSLGVGQAAEYEADAQPQPSGQRVVAAPFEAVDPQPQTQWIGRSIDRTLLAELSRMPGVAASALAEDLADAALLESARGEDADFLIRGEYHVAEPELRITGQVIDVTSGRSIGGLNVTGQRRDLFALQDNLAEQVRRLLPETPRAQEQALEQRAEMYLRHPRIERTGPLRYPEPVVGYYEGSDLQRAVQGREPDYRRYYYERPHPTRFYGYLPYYPYYSYYHVRWRTSSPFGLHGPVRLRGIQDNFHFDPDRGRMTGYIPMNPPAALE